ncbi:MAG TPA: TauD/TfdA family dioxygenase [Pyrinomonadaceae bacterium]|jgi:alpha-ketoglutarate-dependent taurine dioxygenase
MMTTTKAEADGGRPKKDSLSRLRSARAKAISLSPHEMVDLGRLPGCAALPLVMRPRVESLDLAKWTADNFDFVEASLFEHGAILFRGFGLGGLEDFEACLRGTGVELINYMESATPRTLLREKIYTSTEYPAHQSIALHNELSTSTVFPLKIWFFCVEPPEAGGETPIADVRKVYGRLDAGVRERFEREGWMLVRNYGEGFGIPWQKSFHTSDRHEVEEYCRRHDIEAEWKDGGGLRTRQVRSAVARHPKTREPLWFNHVAFWHISSLEPQVREGMLAAFDAADLPYNTYYGDGSPIEDSVVAALREAYRLETVKFRWQRGDLLMLDNMLVAHGRAPYTGPRKVLTAMGEANSRRD